MLGGKRDRREKNLQLLTMVRPIQTKTEQKIRDN